jgi:hypothetical protein
MRPGCSPIETTAFPVEFREFGGPGFRVQGSGFRVQEQSVGVVG